MVYRFFIRRRIRSKTADGVDRKILHVDPANNALIFKAVDRASWKAPAGGIILWISAGSGPRHALGQQDVAPMLFGIAREHGAKIDIDTPMYSQFPKYKELRIRIRGKRSDGRRLNDNDSGLACDDNNDDSPGMRT